MPCDRVGSAASSKATSPTRSDLSSAPGSLPVRGWEAVRRHVLSASSLLVHGSWAYSGRRYGILKVARRVVAQSTPSPVPQARRISKRATHLAFGEGAYWLLFTIPSPPRDPGRWLAEMLLLTLRTREPHDKCIPSTCQLRRAVMRSSKRRASLALLTQPLTAQSLI